MTRKYAWLGTTAPLQRVFAAITVVALSSFSVQAEVSYPKTRTVDQKDVFHGTTVADPYRWLEQDVRSAPEVRAWVDAQNALSLDYLDGIPERNAIRKRLAALWDVEHYGTPFKVNGSYFFFKNDGLQNQDVLYYQHSLTEQPRIALDPNTWSADGTVALADVEVSPNGRYIAYGIQDGGSDWRTWKIKDLKSGKTLDDELRWLKFTNVSWRKDSKGFFYSRYPTPKKGEEFQSLNTHHQLYFHQLGKDQSKDALIYARPDAPNWGFQSNVSDDGRYLLITIWRGTDNSYRLAYLDLNDKKAEVTDLVDEFRYDFALLGNLDDTFYFRSTHYAPKGKVLAITLSKPKEENWRTIVPEAADLLFEASWVGNSLVTHYLKDAQSHIKRYGLNGRFIENIALPGIGSVSGFKGEQDDNEVFYTFSSFNTPATVYHYDIAKSKSRPFKTPATVFNPDDYVVKQVFFTSKDSTRIPMFISHKKALKINGTQPTLLYGYGGFNISLRPSFSTSRLAWMELGGIFAVANLRGGGEYGEAWHQAGTKLNKQNVFDDFIAAGEHLITSGYTNSKKLAISGRSNGGLLVGAVSVQRPELFAAALPAVGVMDMLRFHQFTAGRFWVDDYGSADNPNEFRALYAYSPYHNLKPGVAYPATLITTADTDDRVVPSHSFKYAAALQNAHKGNAPVLIRIETRAGHGAGTPTEMIIDEYSDQWAFLVKNLDMTLPEGYPN